MASSCSRFIRRTALSPLKSAAKSKISTHSFGGSATAPSSSVPLSSRFNCTAPSRRFSLLNRSPAELGCAQSLLPLHSAVAVSRLTSCLSSNSRSCRSLSQEVDDKRGPSYETKGAVGTISKAGSIRSKVTV